MNADLENVKYFGTTTNPESIKYEIVNNEKWLLKKETKCTIAYIQIIGQESKTKNILFLR